MRTVHPLPLDNLHPLQMAGSPPQNNSPHPHLDHSPSPHPNDNHASLIESVVNAIANPSTASSSAQNASQASNLPQSNSHSPPPVHPSLSSNHHLPPPPPGADVSLQAVIASSSKHPPQQQQPPYPPQGGLPMPWPVMLPPALHELPTSRVAAGKRKHDDSDPSEDPHPKIRRVVRDHVSQDPSRVVPMTTVICLHAAVAQKSYGSEKRFLCPPPVVHIEGPLWRMRQQQLSMSVVSEMGERSFEQKSSLDAHMSACFKFLHVSGTAKAKSFLLSLDIAEQPQHVVATPEGGQSPPGRTWATFDSAPITIISKPSKKTAKTRNTASCILGGNPISLFNRINSQTVRTKYMTIDQNQLCASNVSWSAFSVNLVIKPGDVHSHPQSPVTYGCEVILTDAQTGISTAPLIIRKVDKGKIVPDDGGPVSQMQKIALQRINPDGARHYLSAAGPLPGAQPGAPPPITPPSSQPGTHPLIFQSPRVREEVKDGVRIVTDEVDDYLCWTIVGISKFQYTFFDAFGSNEVVPEMPITPFPTLFTAPIYRPAGNSLEMTISNFFYDHPKTRVQTPLDVYLGNLGPLPLRLYQSGPAGPLTSVNPFVHAVPPGPEGGSPSIDPAQAEAAAQAQAAMSQPRYFPTHSLHSIVIAELPPIGDIIRAIEEDTMSPGQRNDGDENGASADGDRQGQDEESRSAPGEKDSGIGTTIAPPHISGRGLPLLFIRSADGVGYHSGRTIACENVFQNMDLSAIGQNPQNPGAGSIDTGWLAAAQAAAAADGGLHGWTLRV
ncbi:hypothetical protein DENSPDRAFT_834136, partial [Dentipellis sp. KUC8613]